MICVYQSVVMIPAHDVCLPMIYQSNHTHNIKFMGCSSGKYINRGGRRFHDGFK